MIRKLINNLRKKKLYIVVNNKSGVSKAKLMRACATVGMANPTMIWCPAIVVKGGDYYFFEKKVLSGKYGIKGEHIDAGKTQCEAGTSLAFGVICKQSEKLDLKLMN